MTMVAISAMAADRLYVDDFTINSGETKTISVKLDNQMVYSAVQFDVKLPAGLTVTSTERGTRCRNHTLTSNTLDDGSVRLWLSSMSSRAISGNSGELIKLTIKASSSFKGSAQLWLKNIVCAHETAGNAGERVELADSMCRINGGLRGDVDGNGMVDVDDVNATINLILLYDQYRDKYPGSADLDGNGMVDVDDVNVLINIILGQ